jgi:hypothetical protein
LSGSREDEIEINRLGGEIKWLRDEIRELQYARMSHEATLLFQDEQLIAHEQAMEQLQFQNHVRMHEMSEGCDESIKYTKNQGSSENGSSSENMSYDGPVMFNTFLITFYHVYPNSIVS